jgi:hypothetical protein
MINAGKHEDYINTAGGWYCYDKQQSLRFPPIGSLCEYNLSGEWIEVLIVGLDRNGRVVYETSESVGVSHDGCESFRPLDSERKQKAEEKLQAKRKAFTDAAVVAAPKVEGVETVAVALFDAGFKAPGDL